MKILQIKYITEKGREAINNSIELTKKESIGLMPNNPKMKIFELYEFDDGTINITNVDEKKNVIINMFTKKAFKKMLKKDKCKNNVDYDIKVIEETQ